MKVKEPVRLRRRKLKDGNTSLYLDIYNKGVRQYEYLRMYLVPEKGIQERNQNNQTLRLAEAVKAKRLLDLQAGRFELKTTAGEMSVRTYLKQFVENKRLTRSAGTYEIWHYYAKVMGDFKLIDTPMSSVNSTWITAYAKFVKSRGLSPRTESYYLQRLKMLFAQAERDGIFVTSPAKTLKLRTPSAAKRTYLTIPELRSLIQAPCRKDSVKRAFLFACITGMRYSDIYRLLWRDIETYGDRLRILFRQKKTGHEEYLDIAPQAEELIGERRKDAELVFQGLPTRDALHKYIRPWVEAAGITKPVSFHTSRHTFAVMMLELDTDIYTLQRLLGHRDISTTQIYADILDRKKRDAVMKIPKL